MEVTALFCLLQSDGETHFVAFPVLRLSMVLFHSCRDLVAGILPEFGKGALLHISETAEHGKLIGVDVAVEIDIGDVNSG